jgi:hypothetical protein
MSRANRRDEPRSVNQDPSAEADRLARRNRLAQLLGRLLARFWLRRRENKEGVTPQEDSQKP